MLNEEEEITLWLREPSAEMKLDELSGRIPAWEEIERRARLKIKYLKIIVKFS